MQKLFLVFILGWLGTPTTWSQVINGIDLSKVESELKNGTALFYVHGAVHPYGHYVATYRDPLNFFNHIEFSLVPINEESKEVFKTLNRHDFVKIKGEFSSNLSPFKHIYVERLEMEKKYLSPIAVPPYSYQTNLPTDLNGKTKMLGKVHAITYDQKVMVIEFQDVVLPLFTTDTELIKNLYRHDVVEVDFRVRKTPKNVLHLQIDHNAENPVKVLDAIVMGHDQPISLTGQLVMFPQSPQIKFNVFALQVKQSQGIELTYTIVNFSDVNLFTEIREMLQKKWDESILTAKPGRNMWINPEVTLTVSGIKNVVSPVQANPQILVNQLTDIQIH
jgi:hypothetical protein